MSDLQNIQKDNLGFSYNSEFFRKIKFKSLKDNVHVANDYLNFSYAEKDLKFMLDTKAFLMDEFTMMKLKTSVLIHSADLFSREEIKVIDENIRKFCSKALPYINTIKNPAEKAYIYYYYLRKNPLLPGEKDKHKNLFNHHMAELVMNGVLLTNDLSPINLNSEEDQQKIDEKLKKLKEEEQQRLRRERERQEQQENDEAIALLTFMIQSKMLIDATAELAEDLIQTQKNILTL